MDELGDGIFSGVRVLEFGLFVAGPYAGELLAHGGADVIKIEPITGDATRWNSTIVPGEGRHYIIKARGKRGAPINLRHPDGLAIVHDLALNSDVIISNMRPGALKRLSLDYESLNAQNERIIVAEISAMGEDGPYGMHLGADFQAAAASGLAMSTANFDGDEPRILDAYLCDFHAGTLLSFGIAGALYRREFTGKGQHVRTSLYQAGLSLQTATANLFDAVDGWKREFADWMEQERPHPRVASQSRRDQTALIVGGFYETRDGHWITLGAGQLAFKRLLDVIGIEDPSAHDPDWEMPDDPRDHFTSLRQRIREIALRYDGEELRERMQAAGVPCALLSSLEEALLSEHARANDYVHSFDHPAVGPVLMPQAPVKFSRDRYRAAEQTPAFGEHLRDVMGELGYDDPAIEKLIESGAIAEELT
ncbi:MAG: CoA transferase [Chloroflexi bacterium]|nr:CoA transferase [Chloroflexota bacterium]MYC01525.1 CoA transferase [Chloroflexota bacterium]MYD74101.1 CoA transferase [Chloroflexota bacterium]